jgi:hypothetical protein
MWDVGYCFTGHKRPMPQIDLRVKDPITPCQAKNTRREVCCALI